MVKQYGPALFRSVLFLGFSWLFGYMTLVISGKVVDVAQPVPCNAIVETKIETHTPPFLGPYKRGRVGVMHAKLSFYDLGPGSINVDEYLDGITSTGRKAIVGRTIAVDPKVIPYGSKVFIPGFGWRVAEDTGGAIRGNRIDILVRDEEEAFKLGRKDTPILWTR